MVYAKIVSDDSLAQKGETNWLIEAETKWTL